ncbi:MAG: peptidase M56, partial [Firmicutes bacterium]|nr:peptidase M56 [Bacillota bacterium]
MLEELFLQTLNMSFTAGFVIIFVLLARVFLKKLPKVFSYALWGVVLFRLICPFSFESVLSLLPIKTNPLSQDIIHNTAPTVDTGIPVINNNIQQLLPVAPPTAGVNSLQIWIFIGTAVWLLGMAILLLYSIVSLMKLQKRLGGAVYEKDNIYLAEHLDTPFVMGIIRPKIYLPAALAGDEKKYILLHEQMHIKRFDHLAKLVSYFALCWHWFNPLVWVAFFVSGRDMEMSCDEAVIKELGSGIKKEYSSSLLTLATGRRITGGIPLAFGEGDTRGRIKNILNYKKPALWVAALSLIIVIVFGIAFAANQKAGRSFKMSGNYLSDLQP